jgi:hypothetical protein
MADYRHPRKFILQWEGGLSRDAGDSASTHPAPWMHKGLSGWHTNKGVTFSTFESLAPMLGYAVTPENFFNMPDRIWEKIFKIGYWDAWRLDEMKSQAIADLLADFAWGSGIGGSFNSIDKYLATKGKQVTNREQATKALSELARGNEKKIFLELIGWREKFFRSLGQPWNLKGWLNRLIHDESGDRQSLKEFGLESIKGSPLRIFIIPGLLLMALAITIIFYLRYTKTSLKLAA